MSKQRAGTKSELTVRTTFEPGRYAKQHVISAYDQVLPNRQTSEKAGKELKGSERGPKRVSEGEYEQQTSSYLRAG